MGGATLLRIVPSVDYSTTRRARNERKSGGEKNARRVSAAETKRCHRYKLAWCWFVVVSLHEERRLSVRRSSTRESSPRALPARPVVCARASPPPTQAPQPHLARLFAKKKPHLQTFDPTRPGDASPVRLPFSLSSSSTTALFFSGDVTMPRDMTGGYPRGHPPNTRQLPSNAAARANSLFSPAGRPPSHDEFCVFGLLRKCGRVCGECEKPSS